MKKEKGITLVSLVITIIILLILAGIAIWALTGENGLFARAKEAREKTQKEAATEKINLVIADVYAENYAEKLEEPTLQDLANGFCKDEETEYVDIVTRKTSAIDKIEVGTNEAIYVKLKKYPYEFKIDGLLKIAEIDGFKVSDTTGSTGGGTGDTGSTGGTGNTVTIDREEYENLTSTVSSLTSTVNNLKTDVDNLKNSGGGTSNSSITSLYKGKFQNEDQIATLSNAYTNYDMLIFRTVGAEAEYQTHYETVLMTKDIKRNLNMMYEATIDSGYTNNEFSGSIKFYFSSTTKLKIRFVDNTGFEEVYVEEIYGVKF